MAYLCYIDTTSSRVPHMEPLDADVDDAAFEQAMRLLQRHSTGVAAHVYHRDRHLRTMRRESLAKRGNRLLDGLDAEDGDAVLAILKTRRFARGEVLQPQDAEIARVHFITQGFAVELTSANGRALQTGAIGRDGMPCLAASLAGATAPSEIRMEMAGAALVGNLEAFLGLVDQRPGVRNALRVRAAADHAEACRSVVRQTLPVNRRLAKWLQTAFRLAETDLLEITQAEIAERLGVQRTSVVGGFDSLGSAKIVKLGRGKIRLLDPMALAVAAG